MTPCTPIPARIRNLFKRKPPTITVAGQKYTVEFKHEHCWHEVAEEYLHCGDDDSRICCKCRARELWAK